MYYVCHPFFSFSLVFLWTRLKSGASRQWWHRGMGANRRCRRLAKPFSVATSYKLLLVSFQSQNVSAIYSLIYILATTKYKDRLLLFKCTILNIILEKTIKNIGMCIQHGPSSLLICTGNMLVKM